MFITPRSQTAHHRVKIETFVFHWLLLKGQSGEILLGVNTYSTVNHERKELKNFLKIW